ncbi:MAG: SOS response-associated peptidase [Halolamina sp.]
MCGRYTLFASRATLERRFEASVPSTFDPRYNCAPGQELLVLRDDDRGRFRRAEWGFTPEWADESMELINARAETVAEKPAFRSAFETRRCVVPADGFYEWADLGDGKRPYRVAFEDDRPFAMAGLWTHWEPPTTQTSLGAFGDEGERDADAVECFTVVTTEPNDVVDPLHHRMAVIIDDNEVERWLADDTPADDLQAMLRTHPGDEMTATLVSDRVGNPANDDPGLLEADGD